MKQTVVKIVNGLGKIVPIVRYDQNVMDSSKKYPLIVFLHGRGEYSDSENNVVVAKNGNHQDILRIADERKDFLVIAPQFIQAYNYDIIDGKPVQTWKPDFTSGYYVNDVIEWALREMPIDPKKIYVTGLSSGGSGTWESIINRQEFTDKIAAAVPVCSGEQIGNYDLPVESNVAVWAFHGTADKDTSPEGAVRSINALNIRGISPKAKITLYQGMGHGIWRTVYSTYELYDWLLEQTNDKIPSTTTSTTTRVPAKTIISRMEITVYSDGTIDTKTIN